MAWIGEGQRKQHLMLKRYAYGSGQPYRTRTACGLYMGGRMSNIGEGSVEEVTCGRCKNTARYVVAKREEGGEAKDEKAD